MKTNKPTILVTGGCGYIGSHTIVDLINHGFEVISADNLSNADEQALQGIEAITGKKIYNYRTELCDLSSTREIFRDHPGLAGVIHFAALKLVGESVEQPIHYFRNNLNSLLNILDCMKEFEVPNLIFSSSCSVYGNAETLPVTETTPWQEAESPYGRSKQMGEQIIRDTLAASPRLNAVLLRYFNPAGAHESALIGEAPTNPATNLVPVITETGYGLRAGMQVFGVDYPTRDGSCIRDYIHVMDLANAHTKSLQWLMENNKPQEAVVFNIGMGEGVTVLEAIQAFEKVSSVKLKYTLAARRPGDVIAIYAETKKAAEVLKWTPGRTIEDIMRTAWNWELARRNK
jgi:UDP-glucose 4-epimerase